MIHLSPVLLKRILLDIESVPEESCGFLFGSSISAINKIDRFLHVKNDSDYDKSKRFKISSNNYKLAEAFAEKHACEMMGIYHTHLDCPPIPSELDKKFAFPGFYYLIISLVDLSFSEVKCWKITSHRKFIEIGIKFNS